MVAAEAELERGDRTDPNERVRIGVEGILDQMPELRRLLLSLLALAAGVALVAIANAVVGEPQAETGAETGPEPEEDAEDEVEQERENVVELANDDRDDVAEDAGL